MTQELTIRARQFRAEATHGEALLWELLRGRALGVRFYRQKVIGPFIADFVCERPKLILEIDGPVHDAQKEQDQERQRYLESRGYRVERFPAGLARTRPHEILDRLRTLLVQRPSRSAERNERGGGEAPPAPSSHEATPLSFCGAE